MVASAVDQRDDVIELPQRPARLETERAQARGASTAADLATQAIGIETAGTTNAAIPLAHAPPELARITVFVRLDARRVPAAPGVDLPLLLARRVQDQFAAPAAGAAGRVTEVDGRTSMLQDERLPDARPGGLR